MWPFLNEKRGSEAEPDADSLRRRPALRGAGCRHAREGRIESDWVDDPEQDH